MRSPPVIPAAQWHSHPCWTRQAYGPLVGFHDGYRRETARLVAAAMDPAVSSAELEKACRELAGKLHAHEQVEEQQLYPWLESHFTIVLATQRAEHAALNACLDRAIAQLGRPAAQRPEHRAALLELDSALRSHLAAEEGICVPALLELPAEAFHALTGD